MDRACSSLIHEYLKVFPCVGIIGPRQCGKTTMLGTLDSTWKIHDLERSADFETIARDPDLFFALNPQHVAIDEVQTLPALFPALRVAIDAQRQHRGRYVITGSSSPELVASISESLAGRIGIVEMGPLSWAEIGGGAGGVIARIVDRSSAADAVVDAASPRSDVRELHRYWLRGGYPEPWVEGRSRFHDLWMQQYVRTYLDRDLSRLFPGLDRNRFRRFLGLLAGLSGSVINYSEVARTLSVSQPTARDYFQIAHGTFLWRNLPAYQGNAVKRIVKHPRGHLRDSGLMHHLARIPDLDALLAHPLMGRSFEAMIVEQILRQLDSLGVGYEAFHYRTSAGAEVDLVLEGGFGVIPVEIKHASSVSARELRPIRDFIRERGCRFGLVVSNDPRPRLMGERLAGIPATHL